MRPSVHLIVGAGHAGAFAALEMRKAGVEGRIVLVGDEPHPPYDRPPLSKDALTNPDWRPAPLFGEAAYSEAGIELLLGERVVEARLAPREVRLAGGSVLGFDKLLLATGGGARKLDIPGGEAALTVRTLDDVARLKPALGAGTRVAVIGAGVIGLEVAASASALGGVVSVIEMRSGPMARFLHPDLFGVVNDLHRKAGVTLLYDVGPTDIAPGPDGGHVVQLSDGREIKADIVIAGIGLAPNLDLARELGLAVETGILVDPSGKTSAPDVYAAGDATSFFHPELGRHVHWQNWQHAQNHGRHVARAMAGETEPYAPLPWFWTDQHGVNFQFTGDPLAADETVWRGRPEDGRFTAFHRLDGRIVGASFVNQGGNNRPTQALIRSGATIDREVLADAATPLAQLLRRS